MSEAREARQLVDVVGPKGPLGRPAGLGVDQPIDGLKAERAHPHRVRARIAKGDAPGGVGEERPALRLQAGPDAFFERSAIGQRCLHG